MQVRDGDPAFAAGDRHTPRFMGLEPASHSLHSHQATPSQRCRRSRPGVRAVDNRDMRTRPRRVSQRDGMFVAVRSRGDIRNRSRVRSHAHSRAEIESPRARVPYTAGREFFSNDTAARGCAKVEPVLFPSFLRPWKGHGLTCSTMTAIGGDDPVRALAPRAAPQPSCSMDHGGIQESTDVHTVRR